MDHLQLFDRQAFVDSLFKAWFFDFSDFFDFTDYPWQVMKTIH
jgi:hypothetical protein